jgi:outer membrane protein insertion porin family
MLFRVIPFFLLFFVFQFFELRNTYAKNDTKDISNQKLVQSKIQNKIKLQKPKLKVAKIKSSKNKTQKDQQNKDKNDLEVAKKSNPSISTDSFVCSKIEDITINGIQRINKRSFEVAIQDLKSSSEISSNEINNFIKSIYATGNFENASAILTPNCYLIIEVEEKPIVSKINFEGNKKINSENLSAEMLTKEKQPLTLSSLFFDVQRFKAIYAKNGFLGSDFAVYKKNNKKDTTKTELFFEIKEGKGGKISSIIFNGNKSFSKKTLLEPITIREYSILKFLSSKSRFDDQTVKLSDESLRTFYAENGYIDYATQNIVSTLNEENLRFDVYLNISEGDKYKITGLKLEGANSELKEFWETKKIQKMIKKLVKLPYYQESRVIELKKQIEQKLLTLGYTMAIVEKNFNRGDFVDKKQTLRGVEVVFEIKNTEKIYINKIRIVGNLKTNDNVIRREILLSNGDLYNADLVKASIQNIRYLGYIKNVNVEEIPTNSKNLIDLEFKIEEGPTGSINFSAGYSTLDRLIAMVGYNQQNIIGRGYDGSINFEKSRFRETVAFSMTNPKIFNTFLLGGLSLVSMKTDSYQIQDFRQETNSGSLSLGYNLSPKLRHIWAYTYRDDKIIIANSSSFSPTIQENFGNFQTRIVSHSIVYDKRNNQMIPTSGFLFRFNQGVAGLTGGNINYFSNELLTSQHIDLYKEMFVFSALFKAGRIRGLKGQGVNIKDRFFFGMTEMRGFEFNGIGPRGAVLNADGTIGSYEAIGLRGNNYEYLSFEQTFPNFIPKDLGFRTYLFYDIGRVYGIDTQLNNTSYAIVDSKSFRHSYGMGLAWQSPMGVIGFDYGIAKKYEAYDQQRRFRLNIGMQRYML